MPYTNDPASVLTDEVRFLIGDTSEPPILRDEEVSYLVGKHSTALRAAYHGALSIAAYYSRKPNKRIGSLSVDYADLARRYSEVAKTLAAQGGFSPDRAGYAVIPLAGASEPGSELDVEWHNTKEA